MEIPQKYFTKSRDDTVYPPPPPTSLIDTAANTAILFSGSEIWFRNLSVQVFHTFFTSAYCMRNSLLKIIRTLLYVTV